MADRMVHLILALSRFSVLLGEKWWYKVYPPGSGICFLYVAFSGVDGEQKWGVCDDKTDFGLHPIFVCECYDLRAGEQFVLHHIIAYYEYTYPGPRAHARSRIPNPEQFSNHVYHCLRSCWSWGWTYHQKFYLLVAVAVKVVLSTFYTPFYLTT